MRYSKNVATATIVIAIIDVMVEGLPPLDAVYNQ